MCKNNRCNGTINLVLDQTKVQFDTTEREIPQGSKMLSLYLSSVYRTVL